MIDAPAATFTIAAFSSSGAASFNRYPCAPAVTAPCINPGSSKVVSRMAGV